MNEEFVGGTSTSFALKAYIVHAIQLYIAQKIKHYQYGIILEPGSIWQLLVEQLHFQMGQLIDQVHLKYLKNKKMN